MWRLGSVCIYTYVCVCVSVLGRGMERRRGLSREPAFDRHTLASFLKLKDVRARKCTFPFAFSVFR